MANIRWLKANFFLTSLKGAFFFIIFLFIFSFKIYAAMEFRIDGIDGNLTEINYDQQIKILYSFNNISAGKIYYIQSGFKEENGSRYFGWTKNDRGDFYRYDESDCTNFYKMEFKESSGSAELWVKPDSESSYFSGTGNYILKLYRFTDTCGSKSDFDNFLTLRINSPASPSPSPSPSPSSNSSSSSSNDSPAASVTLVVKVSPSLGPTPSRKPSPKPSAPSPSPSSSLLISPLPSSSSPEVSASPSPQVLGEASGFNKKLLIPLGFMGAGSLLLGVAFGPALLKQVKERWYTHKI